MKYILLTFTLIVLAFGCSTPPPTASDHLLGLDITSTITQLESAHLKSMEAQRKIAEAILDYTLFHLGFWEVMIETSHVRPNPKIILAIEEIKRMSIKRDELPPGEKLSDYNMSRTVGWGVVLLIGIVEHIPTNTMPQVARLLALF